MTFGKKQRWSPLTQLLGLADLAATKKRRITDLTLINPEQIAAVMEEALPIGMVGEILLVGAGLERLEVGGSEGGLDHHKDDPARQSC